MGQLHMTICKIKNCVYQCEGQCARRITVISEVGVCTFWVKLQQNKVYTDEIIKKEVAVGEGELVQTESEDPVSQDAAQKNE